MYNLGNPQETALGAYPAQQGQQLALPPEMVDQLMQMGEFNRKDELLQQQLAQAEALRGQHPAQGYGLLGGIGAGLTNAFNGINAAVQTRDARQGLNQNMREEMKLADPLAHQLALANLLRTGG